MFLEITREAREAVIRRVPIMQERKAIASEAYKIAVARDADKIEVQDVQAAIAMLVLKGT